MNRLALEVADFVSKIGWLFLGLSLLALFAGCATVSPAQREAAARWQAMADQVTRATGVSRVWIELRSDDRGGYEPDRSTIVLGQKGNTRWLLAHELGHHVLGHRPVPLDRALAQEMAANAQAVKNLQVWGDSEADAAFVTVRHLIGLARIKEPGHNFCLEAADVMRRYGVNGDPRDAGDKRCDAEIAGR